MTFERLPQSEGPSQDIDTFDFSGRAQRLRPRPTARRTERRAPRLSRGETIGIAAAAATIIFPMVASRRRSKRRLADQ